MATKKKKPAETIPIDEYLGKLKKEWGGKGTRRTEEEEENVLKLILTIRNVWGVSNSFIAERLNIQESTVRNFVSVKCKEYDVDRDFQYEVEGGTHKEPAEEIEAESLRQIVRDGLKAMGEEASKSFQFAVRSGLILSEYFPIICQMSERNPEVFAQLVIDKIEEANKEVPVLKETIETLESWNSNLWRIVSMQDTILDEILTSVQYKDVKHKMLQREYGMLQLELKARDSIPKDAIEKMTEVVKEKMTTDPEYANKFTDIVVHKLFKDKEIEDGEEE